MDGIKFGKKEVIELINIVQSLGSLQLPTTDCRMKFRGEHLIAFLSKLD